jgi:hypothetical protein
MRADAPGCIQQLEQTGQYVAVLYRLGVKRCSDFLVVARSLMGLFGALCFF